MLPLEGITVVALEQVVAAPFATRQLADLGARVIKIERPGVGDFARGYDEAVRGMSSHFVWLNRSKESLSLNLKQAEADQIMGKLLEKADVFVQNLAPGAADRLGLAADILTSTYPRLIVCGISGYGSTGPYRDRKAYDLLIQGETGLLSITGTPDTPSKVGISIADIAAGMYAFTGILTALYERTHTGRGTTFEVSMFEALGEWMSYAAYYTLYGGEQPRRTGASHAAIAPYGPFRTGDGNEVYLAVHNEREWASFCEVVLAQPELASDARFESTSRRVKNREVLQQTIEEAFTKLSAAEIMRRLERAQIANARMNTVQEFVDHPQLRDRDRWREVASPVGTLRTLIPPVTRDGTGAGVRMDAIPDLGQHTTTILQELGYDQKSILMLRENGVI